MEDFLRPCLELLEAFRSQMEQLTDLAKLKAAVVQNDDLLALNEIMNQEQAIAMAFRGLEQKQQNLLSRLGAADLPLSGLVSCFPAGQQGEVRQAVEALQTQYHTYRLEADKARGILEGGIHEIEKILEGAGAVSTSGPGYRPPEAQTPPTMKTDFRA